MGYANTQQNKTKQTNISFYLTLWTEEEDEEEKNYFAKMMKNPERNTVLKEAWLTKRWKETDHESLKIDKN